MLRSRNKGEVLSWSGLKAFAEKQAARWPFTVILLLVIITAGCSAGEAPVMNSQNSEAANLAYDSGITSYYASGETAATITQGTDNSGSTGSAATAGVTSPAPEAASASALQRKIIYEADLAMKTSDYTGVVDKIQAEVSKSGGYVLEFNESGRTGDGKRGRFVIKVPGAGFDSLMSRIEAIGPLESKSMRGQDVTEEFVDLEARLKVAEVAESRLLSFMEKATKTEELVAFSSELTKVQQTIEQIKGRMRYLEQNVTFSTIRLTVEEKISSAEALKAADKPPLAERALGKMRDGWAVFVYVMEGLILALSALLPFLLVLAVIIVPIWLTSRRRREKEELLRQQRLQAAAERAQAAAGASDQPAPASASGKQQSGDSNTNKNSSLKE